VDSEVVGEKLTGPAPVHPPFKAGIEALKGKEKQKKAKRKRT